MKPPHIYLLAGLVICVVAVILVISKIEANFKNRDTYSNVFNGDENTSVVSDKLMNRDLPRSTRRQRAARENLAVLSRFGYVLTADNVGDHKAEGKVHITAPDGRILKSDSMTISSDGENILLHGSVSVVSESGPIRYSSYADSFARIALDGSSQSFVGTLLYEPGSTFMIPNTAKAEIEHSPN